MADDLKWDQLGADEPADPKSVRLHHHEVALGPKLKPNRQQQDRCTQDHEST